MMDAPKGIMDAPIDPHLIEKVKARIHLGEDRMLSNRWRTSTGRFRWEKTQFSRKGCHVHTAPRMRENRVFK